MNLKKIMAAACAVVMTGTMMVSCGSDTTSDSKANGGAAENSDVEKMDQAQQDKVKALESKLPDVDLKNKEIKWMAHYDINPSKGEVEDPGLALFKSKYGGSIKYEQTTWDNRYTDLAKNVMANQAPDFFPADDMDAFPKGAIGKMFEPIDDYIDLNSDIWKDSKNNCDQFVFNNKHYIAVIESQPCYVCVYNTKTIKDTGYDDPAELYEDGEWTWSKFAEMCSDFTDENEKKYGLDGYWYNKALNDTCGVPLIGMKDGKIVNNMSDPAVTKVQGLMYNLQKDGVVFPRCDNNWNTRGDGKTNGEGIGSHLTLFVPIGLWALETTKDKTKAFGDIEKGEVMFVPMPKFDDDDAKHYMSARINGYALCKDAPNPEGFAAYMNCLQVAHQEAADIHIDQLKNKYGWNEDMLKMREECYELARTNPVFDFQDGVSPELKTLMNDITQATMITGGDATTWTACVTANKKAVDYVIKDANASITG